MIQELYILRVVCYGIARLMLCRRGTARHSIATTAAAAAAADADAALLWTICETAHPLLVLPLVAVVLASLALPHHQIIGVWCVMCVAWCLMCDGLGPC